MMNIHRIIHFNYSKADINATINKINYLFNNYYNNHHKNMIIYALFLTSLFCIIVLYLNQIYLFIGCFIFCFEGSMEQNKTRLDYIKMHIKKVNQ